MLAAAALRRGNGGHRSDPLTKDPDLTRQNPGNRLACSFMTRFGRRHWQRITTLMVALMLGAMTGCPDPGQDIIDTTRPPEPARPRSLEEIMESIHANAALLNRPLWSSSVHVVADFPDSRGKPHKYNLDGTLLYRKPRELRVDLRPSIGDPVMQIGSNKETFWIWVEPELQMMRWGKHEHVGKPCSGRMSIRPDQLVQSLGLQRLTSTDPTLAGPALSAARDYDKLTYIREYGPKGFALDRELYVDRSPPFMIRVMRFFDPQGRESMRASLDKYGPAWRNGPLVPHVMVFDWPQDGGRLSLEISKVGPPTGAVNPRAFIMPDARRLPRGITDIEQVDAECDGAPPPRGRQPAYEEEPIYNEYAPPEEPPADAPSTAERGSPNFRNDPNVDWNKPREPIPEGYGPPPDPPGRPRPSPIPRDPRIETYDRERGAPPAANLGGDVEPDAPPADDSESGGEDETQG